VTEAADTHDGVGELPRDEHGEHQHEAAKAAESSSVRSEDCVVGENTG
jgi:hypothetical protein